MPANGVVRLLVSCELRCGFAPDAEVVVFDTTTNAQVSGAIVARSDDDKDSSLSWKPDEPLVAGRTYRVAAPGLGLGPARDVDEEATFDFVALPAATWTLDAVDVTPQLKMEARVETTVSCPLAHHPFTPGGGQCFPDPETQAIATHMRDYVQLNVYVTSLLPTEQIAGQYEARAAIWAQGESESELSDAFTQSWDDAQSGYCYRVELHSFIDDTTATLEDCVEHGALGEPGVVPVEDAMLVDSLMPCIAPPDGLDEEWCLSQRRICGTLMPRSELSCEQVEEQCAGVAGSVPVDVADDDATEDGAAGAAGMSGEEMMASNEAIPRDMPAASSGCSALGARSSNGMLPLWMLAGCAALARVRGSRRR